MTTVTITGSGLIGVTVNYSDNTTYIKSLRSRENGSDDRKRRRKEKSDPNQLRMKSKNKSTRPKWMNRIL